MSNEKITSVEAMFKAWAANKIYLDMSLKII